MSNSSDPCGKIKVTGIKPAPEPPNKENNGSIALPLILVAAMFLFGTIFSSGSRESAPSSNFDTTPQFPGNSLVLEFGSTNTETFAFVLAYTRVQMNIVSSMEDIPAEDLKVGTLVDKKYVENSEPRKDQQVYIFQENVLMHHLPLANESQVEQVIRLASSKIVHAAFNYSVGIRGPPKFGAGAVVQDRFAKVYVVGKVEEFKGADTFGRSEVKSKIIDLDLHPTETQLRRYERALQTHRLVQHFDAQRELAKRYNEIYRNKPKFK